MGLAHLTDEQRAEALVKGRAARAAKAAARVGNPLGLKLEYADAGHWDELARKHKIARMPSKLDQVDATMIRTWVKKLGLSFEEFNEHFTGVKEFVRNNQKWTKYATAGVMLELKDALHG